MKVPPHIMKMFVDWAKANNKPRPTTSQGMSALFAEFASKNQHLINPPRPRPPQMPQMPAPPPPPAWDEIPDDKQTILTWDGTKTTIVDGNKEPDDFDEMVAQREQAMIEGGHDDLARDAILQEKNSATLAAASPPSNTNPVTATNALLGGQVSLTPPPIGQSDITAEVARWNGNDSEATNISVVLGPAQVVSSLVQTAQQQFQGMPYAIVQWGTRGYAVQAEVDLGLGMQFTIAASYVSLQLAMEALKPLQAASPRTPIGLTQKLTGMLAFRNIERGAVAATRTRSVWNASDKTQIDFTIPPFAKSIIAVMDGAFNESLTIFPTNIVGQSLFTTTATATATTSPTITNPIILPPEAIGVSVAPSAGGNFSGNHIGLVFALAL